MKQIMLLLVATIATTMLFAQDVIVTTEENAIAAKVLSVSSNQVKYLEYTMLEGPTFVLNTSEISCIIFEHGHVKVFDKPSSNSVIQRSTFFNDHINRYGNTYYYQDKQMKGSHYANFLKKHSMEAYNLYKNGESLAILGWCFLGIGVGLDIGFTWWLPYSWIPALGFEIACIPTLIVGYTKMHRSADIFNATCVGKPQVYWSVTASQNGVGLALNF